MRRISGRKAYRVAFDSLESRALLSATPTNLVAITESFDTTPEKSLPANWSQWIDHGQKAFAVSTNAALSAPASLVASGGFSQVSRAWPDALNAEDARVSAAMFLKGGLIHGQIFARGSNLNSTTPNFYAVSLTDYDSSATAGLTIQLLRVVNGATTVLRSLDPATSFAQGWVKTTLDVSGGTLKVQVVRVDTGQYLNGSGQWQSGQAWALEQTDTAIATGGQVGLARDSGYAGTTYFDDFSAQSTWPPAVTAAANQTGVEGTAATIDLGSFTDPGVNGFWSVDVDWGDGTPHAAFPVTATGPLGARAHTYATTGTYTTTVRVIDAGGASGSASFQVLAAAANAPPPASLFNLAQNFDSTVIGGLPAGWVQYKSSTAAGFAVQDLQAAGKTPPSTPNGLTFAASGSGDRGWVSPPDAFSKDVQVSLKVRSNTPLVGIFARGSGQTGPTPSFYALEVQGGGPSLQLVRYLAGTRSVIRTVSAASKYLPNDTEWVTLTLRVSGTGLKGMLYRPSLGMYLTPEGAWTTIPTWAINEADTAISSGSGVGIVRDVSNAGAIYVDDFAATDITGDFTRPTITISAPAPGAALSGIVALAVQASDNTAVDRVEYFADGTRIGIVRQAPYTLPLDTARLGNGSHTLTARVYDPAENWSEASVVVATSNDLSTPAPAIVPKEDYVKVGGFVSTNTDPANPNGMDTLIRDEWSWVKSDSTLIDAVNSWSPGINQVLYTNTSNIYTNLLLDWNEWADTHGVSREEAFYHVLTPRMAASGAGGSSWQSARFWNVQQVASGKTTNYLAASYNTTTADVPFGSAAGDALVMGYPEKFREVRFFLASAAAGGWSGRLQYCTGVDAAGNPTSWADLPLTSDETRGFTTVGNDLQAVFDPPADWVPCQVAGGIGGSSTYGYYVRVLTTSGGTAPVASQVLSYDFSGIGANGTGQSAYPAFDRKADLNGDGYLNATEYANRTPGMDAYFQYQARADFGYGDWRPSTNPGNAYFRQWAVDYHRRVLAANPGAVGFFMDNSVASPGGRIGSTPVVESLDNYVNDYGSLCAEIWHNVGWVAGNISGSPDASALTFLRWSPAYTYEALIRAYQYTRADFDRVRQGIVDREAAGVTFGLLDSRDEPSIPLEPDGYQNHRLQLSTLAFYYLVAEPHTYLGVFDDTSTTNARENTIQAIPFDVGAPVDANPSTWDPGAAQSVVKRQYANALVLWRPMATSNPPNSAKDDPTTAITYDLGGVYRPVLYDGTLGPAITTITLRNGEGAILVPDTSSSTMTFMSQTTAATSVTPTGTATATSGAAVQPSTTAITPTGPSGTVPATFSDPSTADTATLTPNSALAPQTTDSATVGGATEPAGHVMGPISWSSITAGAWKPSMGAEAGGGRIVIPLAGTTGGIETKRLTASRTWSNWAAVSNGGAIASPSGHHPRNQAALTTGDPTKTSALDDISFLWR